MARVYVSVGSNIDRDANIRSCLEELRARFGELIVSTIYETKAVGFEGDNFYNLVVAFETEKDVHAVSDILHAIEDAHGRNRAGQRFSSRTLDLDLLLYDALVLKEQGLELPRGEITRYAFVLLPLAEIAGELVHPTEGKTIQALWEAFDASAEEMHPVQL
jgi:2-amino-4-hydroxy-6-hydroxymethyldihydropteridine diphosphokinase